jgi:hypothetical protein
VPRTVGNAARRHRGRLRDPRDRGGSRPYAQLLAHDDAGKLIYSGRAGSGISDAELERLAAALAVREQEDAPVPPPRAGVPDPRASPLPMVRAAICSCYDILETFRNPAMRFLIGHNAPVRPLAKRDKGLAGPLGKED